MQPRWNEYWLEEGHDVFLGGTNEVDLWLDSEGDLRMCKGFGTDGWDYWRMMKDGSLERLCSDTDLIDEQVAQAFIYLDLFVPDLGERMKEAQNRYAAQVV